MLLLRKLEAAIATGAYGFMNFGPFPDRTRLEDIRVWGYPSATTFASFGLGLGFGTAPVLTLAEFLETIPLSDVFSSSLGTRIFSFAGGGSGAHGMNWPIPIMHEVCSPCRYLSVAVINQSSSSVFFSSLKAWTPDGGYWRFDPIAKA